MDPVLDISLNLYLIRSVVVLAVAAGAYFLRYDKLYHLFEGDRTRGGEMEFLGLDD